MTLNDLFAAGRKGNLIALLAGVILTFAFAPFKIFPLAILSPALLLCTWLKVSPGQAFLRGWLFGLGLFGTGLYWVYISIHTYEDLSVIWSLLITFGFINILALFPALTGYTLNHYFPKNTYYKILLAFPVYWVLFEWVRGWLFTGFPWLSIGYSQLDSFLAGYAPLFSVHGISLTAILCAALLVHAAIQFRKQEKLVAYKNIAVLVFIWIVGGCFSLVMWTTPYRQPIQVSLVQGNITHDITLSPEHLKPILDRYQSLTLPYWKSDIIIWPENAIPVPLQYTGAYLGALDNAARRYNTTFITGIPIKSPKKEGYYNAVIAIGSGNGAYLKTRLVPFAEFVPFAFWLHKFIPSVNTTKSNFISGFAATDINTTPQLNAKGLRISTFIGYEIAFPQQVRSGYADINLLLNVSNNTWSRNPLAEAQYLQMAEMRAVEMRRPLLLVSNDAITAIIGPTGKIEASIPAFTPGVLTHNVQPREGETPWQQTGFDPLLVILAAMLIYAVRKRKTDDANKSL
jgi:apolipoprotein N-acyltransferase